VSPPGGLAPLCRYDGHSCGACCWGDAVRRPALEAHLRRNGRRFRRWFAAAGPPSPARLLGFELAARGGLDVLLAVLLVLPGIGDLLRPWLGPRLTCAFLGFEDDAGRRVGCLLHPQRWAGVDVRPVAAFRLLAGVGCGRPDFYCPAAHRFARATWQERRALARRAAGLDWYGFSRVAPQFRPGG
jgi:hypothetical protein